MNLVFPGGCSTFQPDYLARKLLDLLSVLDDELHLLGFVRIVLSRTRPSILKFFVENWLLVYVAYARRIDHPTVEVLVDLDG
jgi:hypothetical protein